MKLAEQSRQDQKLNEFAKKQQQEKIKKMIKYSYELRKIGLVDSLRQNIASELTNDIELNLEIKEIISILNHYLEKKEIDNYLWERFPESYQEYRNNILNINLLDTLETKIKAGEVNVNKVRQIIKRYDNKIDYDK